MSAPAPTLTAPRPNATRPHWQTEGAWLQLVIFAIALLIVCSRRPDALAIPQFYAEDGTVFYSEAYSLGLHALVLPRSGYFHTVPRLVVLFDQLFPLVWAPLIVSLAAMAIQILPVNVFLSSRFSNIDHKIRMLGSFVYLALPNSFEIHATLTNAQCHLILLSLLLLLASPARTRAWKIFDSITLALTCLSNPMGILLLPVAALVWWYRAQASSALSFAVLLPVSTIQSICVLTHLHMRSAPHVGLQPVVGDTLGSYFQYLDAIVGRQIFFSSLLGLNTQNWLIHLRGAHFLEVTCTMLGSAVLLYTLSKGPLELKLFIVFAASVLVFALANPLAGPADRSQWYWLSQPGIGNRYYFLPMLAFLTSLFWLATNRARGAVRSLAIALLLLLPIGICRDWTYPPFMNFGFGRFAQEFDEAPVGTKFTLPINPPGWFMTLTKH